MFRRFKNGLLVCLLFIPICLSAQTHYIGLGRDCQVASHLDRCHMRKAAYPFDWMVSHHFLGIAQAINEDFAHFLDPNFLVYKTHFIENVYYQFLFNHFFPLVGHPVTEEVCDAGTVVPNFLDYLPNVQATQNRRIKRLLDLMSGNERVVFIRTHANVLDAANFVCMVKSKFPKLDFTLAVVNDMAAYNGNWDLPHVINYYAKERCGFVDWWTFGEWDAILNHLQSVMGLP